MPSSAWLSAATRIAAYRPYSGSVMSGSQIPGRAIGIVAAVHVEDEVFGRVDVETEQRGAHTSEAHACSVCSNRECLATIAAIDFGGIDSIAALEEIGIVTRVPNHAVIASLPEDLVITTAAGQRVVPGAAEQLRTWQCAITLVQRDPIVSGLSEDLN
jgi:hypothetical protein